MDNATKDLLIDLHRRLMTDIRSEIFCDEEYRRSASYVDGLFKLQTRIFNQLTEEKEDE